MSENMNEKEIICVVCPSSCRITVKGEGKQISEMTGFSCKRGEAYARSEYISPVRTLTSTVKAKDYSCPIIPVRSDKPMPKNKVFDAMALIQKAQATPPYYVGKVIIENILDTGVNIVLSNC